MHRPHFSGSGEGRKKIFKRFFAEAEYAHSILNNDIRSSELDSSKSLSGIEVFIPRTTNATRQFNAYNASLGYQGNNYSIRLKYERIDPEYQTLGAYYFNNDMENITIIPAIQLFQQKVNISGNIGIQKNNLDKDRAATTKRVVSAINGSYMPNEHWNFSLNYSNFSTYTNLRPQTDPFYRNNMDTLNFYQITNAMSGLTGFNFGTKERVSNIMVNLSLQKAKDAGSYENGINNSSFYTGNISYNYSIIPQSMSVSASVNYYIAALPGIISKYWGPNANISKSFFDKMLKATYSSSFNANTLNNKASGSVLNNRMGLTYTPKSSSGEKEKSKTPHHFTLGLNFLKRFIGADMSDGVSSPKFSEFTCNFTYNYSF